MEKKVFTKDDIAELKNKAQAMNPAVKVVNLNQLSLDEHSVANNTIKFDGTPIRVANGFMRNLAHILNVNIKLEKNLKADEEIGQDMLAHLLNALNSFTSRKRVPRVTLVCDKHNGIFTNVVAGNFARLSNEGLFGIAEQLLENNNGLELIDCKVSDIMPDVSMKLLAPKPHRLVNNNDEIFNFGLTLTNSAINTFIGDFAYRLICTNGMMGLKSENNFKLSDIGTQGLLDMHTHLIDASERKFMPADFESNVSTAQKIEASFAEVETAWKFVKRQINCTEDQRDRIEASILFKYFPGYFNTIDKLKRHNLQIKDMDPKQKQMLPSGMKMWELINNITFLGSNHIGIEFLNTDKLLVYGGKLMGKDADLKYASYLFLK